MRCTPCPGDGGQAQPDIPLATVLVEGREQVPATLPDTLIAPPDLSDVPSPSAG